MKVLNLYAGIGGNRAKWGGSAEVTAVELDKSIAKVYSELWPDDEVVVGDAHKFLLEHADEYKFIWSSPPCQSHSVTNGFLHAQGIRRYPDLRLYEEIIYLQRFYGGEYAVENVRSYYRPLIVPQVLGRHYIWSSVLLPKVQLKPAFNTINARASTRLPLKELVLRLEKKYGICLGGFGLSWSKRLQLLKNCVNPQIGRIIWNAVAEAQR